MTQFSQHVVWTLRSKVLHGSTVHYIIMLVRNNRKSLGGLAGPMVLWTQHKYYMILSISMQVAKDLNFLSYLTE